LRKVVGKSISLEKVFHVIESALERGILNIKLYFMVGLPTEEQADVDGIAVLVKRIRQLMMDSRRPNISRSPRLTVSVSPFVPKPHTPFQWCRMEDVKTLSQKLLFLRRELGKIGGVRMPSSSARWSAVQGVLARGDRKLANVLYDIGRESISWSQSLKKNGLSQDFYLQRPRQTHEAFPWDHINLGISKSHLLEQFLVVSN
jgi:radical SAM superfamily enzyme YgiQ (UPF0313 family)